LFALAKTTTTTRESKLQENVEKEREDLGEKFFVGWASGLEYICMPVVDSFLFPALNKGFRGR
jgi:hypothetical protein